MDKYLKFLAKPYFSFSSLDRFDDAIHNMGDITLNVDIQDYKCGDNFRFGELNVDDKIIRLYEGEYEDGPSISISFNMSFTLQFPNCTENNIETDKYITSKRSKVTDPDTPIEPSEIRKECLSYKRKKGLILKHSLNVFVNYLK